MENIFEKSCEYPIARKLSKKHSKHTRKKLCSISKAKGLGIFLESRVGQFRVWCIGFG